SLLSLHDALPIFGGVFNFAASLGAASDDAQHLSLHRRETFFRAVLLPSRLWPEAKAGRRANLAVLGGLVLPLGIREEFMAPTGTNHPPAIDSRPQDGLNGRLIDWMQIRRSEKGVKRAAGSIRWLGPVDHVRVRG